MCPLFWFFQMEGMTCLPRDACCSSLCSWTVFLYVHTCHSAPIGSKYFESRRVVPLYVPQFVSCGFCSFGQCSFGELTEWRKWVNFTKHHLTSSVESACAWVVWLPVEYSSLDPFVTQSMVYRPAKQQRLAPKTYEVRAALSEDPNIIVNAWEAWL